MGKNKDVNFPYRCPECGRHDKIDIAASVYVRLVQHDEENFETDADLADDHDTEWGDDSFTVCRAPGCRFSGKMTDFKIPEVG